MRTRQYQTGGWLRVCASLEEQPENQKCYEKHSDGNQSLLPSTEQQLPTPFPLEEEIECCTDDGARQLQVEQGSDDEAEGGEHQKKPNLPDALPSSLEHNAQHQSHEEGNQRECEVVEEHIQEGRVHGVIATKHINLLSLAIRVAGAQVGCYTYSCPMHKYGHTFRGINTFIISNFT